MPAGGILWQGELIEEEVSIHAEKQILKAKLSYDEMADKPLALVTVKSEAPTGTTVSQNIASSVANLGRSEKINIYTSSRREQDPKGDS